MKFPGNRKKKHYFPVSEKGRMPFEFDFTQKGGAYIVGIDQLLVDIEVKVDEAFLAEYNLKKGESSIIDDNVADELYYRLKKEKRVVGEFAGGAVGNTLHNYSILSDDRSVALGVISKSITVGDYAFKYICNTCSHVDFSYLQPLEGPMGRAFCFVTGDGERTFGISKGRCNELSPDFVPESVIKGAAVLLISAFLLRDETTPMFASVMKAAKIAKENNIPIVMSLGTSSLIESKRDFFKTFIKDYVSVIAMNDAEAYALTGLEDPLLAGEASLDFAELVLLTVGPEGLYLSGLVDFEHARETSDELHSKSISEYNKLEFSRVMRRRDCKRPVKVYTHINPFMGGPGKDIKNTNGAGDAALAAVIHDMVANTYHKLMVPKSPKHVAPFITYSSIAQISKYANRVSYEVLCQNSPRLIRGLPEKEDCLEESYWAK